MKWLWALLGTVLAAALVVAAGAYWVHHEAHRPLELPPEGVVYQLQPGTSLRALGRDLEEKGIISSRWALEAWARWQGGERGVRAGEYRFEPGATIVKLLDQLRRGEMVQHKFTITEGSIFREVVDAMQELVAQGLVRKTTEPTQLPKAFVQWTGLEHPEGWIFPDTYLFARGISDKELLMLAHRSMKETLGAAWDRRKDGLPFKKPYEALILASIVEKETGIAEERPLIAGVFINRLKANMLLQTDPTVIYGMGEDYDGNIRKSDLQTDTPYNTYTRLGLPPTPIAMPGKAAIEAVLNPQHTDALYFVAKGGGAHHFSRTYAEHRDAVVRYQLGGHRERYTGDQSAAPAEVVPVERNATVSRGTSRKSGSASAAVRPKATAGQKKTPGGKNRR